MINEVMIYCFRPVNTR